MGGSGLGISFCCSISLIVGQILHCSLLTVQSAGFELKSTTAVGSETNVRVKSLDCARLFVTPWTVVYHAPPFMGFSSKSTGVSCHFFLQRIFLNHVLNPDLPHCRQMLYHLGHWGSQSQRNAMPKKVQTTAQLYSFHILAR